MKITPFEDRVLVRLIDPRKDKTDGGIIIPNRAQVEPKVFEAEVIAISAQPTPACGNPSCDQGCAPAVKMKIGDRVLIPNRVLGDRLSDGTVFVRASEIFGKVEDSKIIEAAGLVAP